MRQGWQRQSIREGWLQDKGWVLRPSKYKIILVSHTTRYADEHGWVARIYSTDQDGRPMRRLEWLCVQGPQKVPSSGVVVFSTEVEAMIAAERVWTDPLSSLGRSAKNNRGPRRRHRSTRRNPESLDSLERFFKTRLRRMTPENRELVKEALAIARQEMGTLEGEEAYQSLVTVASQERAKEARARERVHRGEREARPQGMSDSDWAAYQAMVARVLRLAASRLVSFAESTFPPSSPAHAEFIAQANDMAQDALLVIIGKLKPQAKRQKMPVETLLLRLYESDREKFKKVVWNEAEEVGKAFRASSEMRTAEATSPERIGAKLTGEELARGYTEMGGRLTQSEGEAALGVREAAEAEKTRIAAIEAARRKDAGIRAFRVLSEVRPDLYFVLTAYQGDEEGESPKNPYFAFDKGREEGGAHAHYQMKTIGKIIGASPEAVEAMINEAQAFVRWQSAIEQRKIEMEEAEETSS